MKTKVIKMKVPVAGQMHQTNGPANNLKKIDELKAKLKEIEEVKIPQIIARRSEAASWGDLSENAGYEQANADLTLYQSMAYSLKVEIKHLEEGV